MNATTDGNQQVPSIGCDADGNAVVAWTGVGSNPGTTDVYTGRIAGTEGTVGPIVTDVTYSTIDSSTGTSVSTHVFDGDAIQPASPLTQLVVTFDEGSLCRHKRS